MAYALLDRYAIARAGYEVEHLASPSVRSLIIGLVEPTGVIYQPGPGLAQLLIDAAAASGAATRSLFAQELTPRGAAMARVNLDIHDLDATVACGDVFDQDAFPDLRARTAWCRSPRGTKEPSTLRLWPMTPGGCGASLGPIMEISPGSSTAYITLPRAAAPSSCCPAARCSSGDGKDAYANAS